MNIKLDKDVRIRLTDEDVRNWKASGYLAQSFTIGAMDLQVTICRDSAASKSRVHSEGQKLVISLASGDCISLVSPARSTEGLSIGNINIQIDQWSKDKRNRHEERMKGRLRQR
ncbi:MAG TPA: hypothetical protein PKC28_04350 [Bdellovibrionales bacterium]|nr:hypothetical protein [Bdellovibrionales bacterium]